MSRTRIYRIAERLSSRYKDFSHFNRKNPLDEFLFITLSLTTTEPVYRRTFRSLKRAYPSFDRLMNAPVSRIAAVIKEGGQSRIKARAIKASLQILAKTFGRPTLAPLRRMSTGDCEEFLMSLPGIGKKVARCILMYSFHRPVFPVDTHCWRVASRLGLIDPRKSSIQRGADLLQEAIPPSMRFSVHVNMLSLGRDVCRANQQSCGRCPLSLLCPTRSILSPS